jgi:hypothetical protein
MTPKDIARLGKFLAPFLIRFADCFARPAGRALLQVYVRGLLSDVQRKNAEAIALIILSQLFCARVRQQLSPSEDVVSGELLTTKQVRRAANVVVQSLKVPPRTREQLYRAESERQNYHAHRNAQASKSHRKTRRKRLAELGVDPDKIKSVPPKNTQ